jgi:hypothetical protein
MLQRPDCCTWCLKLHAESAAAQTNVGCRSILVLGGASPSSLRPLCSCLAVEVTENIAAR